MKAFVTGGAGFIGSHLVNALLKKNYRVVVFDNFSIGKHSFLPSSHQNIKIVTGDITDYLSLEKEMCGSDIVFHFAANSDVRKGTQDTHLDLQQGIIATHNVLEAMKKNNIKKIIFPSSMTVYGVSKIGKISESYGPCLPISLYAAAKLGAEGLISAYASMFGMQAYIFRFANVIGSKLTHGVIYDLIHKLLQDKTTLSVLGDGTQTKPYVYVDDVINAILFVQQHTKEQVSIYNIGVNDTIAVKGIVSCILKEMNLAQTNVLYAKETQGWVGDVTQCSLDITKIAQLGFSPKYSSKEAVIQTIRDLLHEIGYNNE